jgi:hypothetical protein
MKASFGCYEQVQQQILHLLRRLRKTTSLICRDSTNWKIRVEMEVDYVEKLSEKKSGIGGSYIERKRGIETPAT